MAQFHYFSLEEVYQYAESKGYSREDVSIERVCTEYDYDLDREVAWEYVVSFGCEYSEMWSWSFESLDQVAWDYDHSVCGD